MRVPVFVSSPTQLSSGQNRSRNVVIDILEDLQLEPRALGRSDYPKDFPLKEVHAIAKHCHGGVILGFEQFQATTGTWKRGTKEEKRVHRSKPVSFPTPWNHLESGILFGLRLPLLIFQEADVFGGAFDVGTTEVFGLFRVFSGWPTGSRLLHPADPTSPAVTSEPKRRPRNPQIPYTPVRSWATRKGNKTLINRELSL